MSQTVCPQCGAPPLNQEAFCTRCGTPLNAVADRVGPIGQSQPGQSQPPMWQPQPRQPQPVPQQPGPQPWPGQPWQGQPGPPGPQSGQPFPAPGPGNPVPGGWQQPPATPRAALPPFRFDLRRLTTVDQVIGGATAFLLITLFLPWFGVSGPGYAFSVSGISAHGLLALPLLVSLALVAYLVMRAGWGELPFKIPVAHAPLLLIGTAAQLLFVVIAFLLKPSYLQWEFGAYLALLAGLVACAPIVVPAVNNWQQRSGL